MLITDMGGLSHCLETIQTLGACEVRCEFSHALSARMSDAALMQALVLGLPMAQGIQQRIVRSRGRGVVLTARIRYRTGVRILAGKALTAEEQAALVKARMLTAELMRLSEPERFRAVYDWLCTHVRYVHTSPGRKGYERLVCASGALLDGQANCQGFADALYLLCGLLGIPCVYRCGLGSRQLHLWNEVCLDGVWQTVDASKRAREQDSDR